jgi:putative chitinase
MNRDNSSKIAGVARGGRPARAFTARLKKVADAALTVYQAVRGPIPAEVAGTVVRRALGKNANDAAGDAAGVTAEKAMQIFDGARPEDIAAYLPLVMQALAEAGIADRDMALMALATIRVETAGFRPIDEGVSKYNTTPGAGRPFDRYDFRKALGNRAVGDGARYKGRGFIQLTGRANYIAHGAKLGVDLEGHPELANDPHVAARVLASFLQEREGRIRAALARNDLAAARRAVNGGSHGLTQFIAAFQKGQALF